MNHKKNKNAVIIFTRYPEFGKVKTRLAASVGNESAYNIHKLLAEHTIRECLKLDENEYTLFVFYLNEGEEKLWRDWLDIRFLIYSQLGADLGEKMANAFESVFTLGFEKIILIGTDIPDISETILTKSFKVLDKNEIVIGPSKDGGYYLIGMNKYFNKVFEGINWGNDSVFKNTIEKIELNNLNFETIDKLNDIDVIEDLLNWYDKNKTDNENSLVKVISKIKN